MSTLQHEPWRALPRDVARVIAPDLPSLRDEILEVIAAEVPDYARPLEGAFGRGIRLGVEEALRQFADLVADPERGRAQSREVYLALGRGEMREGRSLDALQAAYRVGARVAWRRLAETGLRAGLAPEVLCALADAIFAYIDELSSDSVEGYAQAQQAAAGERERRRRRVVAALLADPFEHGALRQAAPDAGWMIPRGLAVLACAPADLDRIARRLTPDALAVALEDVGCVVVKPPAGNEPPRSARHARPAMPALRGSAPAARWPRSEPVRCPGASAPSRTTWRRSRCSRHASRCASWRRRGWRRSSR